MSPTNRAFDISNYEAKRLVARLDGNSYYTPEDICRALTNTYTIPNAADAADVLIAALQTVVQTHEVSNAITRLRRIKPDLTSLEDKPEAAAMGLMRCFCDCYGDVTYDDFMNMLNKLIPAQ